MCIILHLLIIKNICIYLLNRTLTIILTNYIRLKPAWFFLYFLSTLICFCDINIISKQLWIVDVQWSTKIKTLHNFCNVLIGPLILWDLSWVQYQLLRLLRKVYFCNKGTKTLRVTMHIEFFKNWYSILCEPLRLWDLVSILYYSLFWVDSLLYVELTCPAFSKNLIIHLSIIPANICVFIQIQVHTIIEIRHISNIVFYFWCHIIFFSTP